MEELKRTWNADETKKLSLLKDGDRYEVRISYYTEAGFARARTTPKTSAEAEEAYNQKTKTFK